MSTPRYTAEGVKIAHAGGSVFHCGHCGEFMMVSYGVPSGGVDCSHCGRHNRPDFSLDLLSERIAGMALRLRAHAMRFDSITIADAADDVAYMADEARSLEATVRIVLGGDEPLHNPHIMARGAM